MRLSTLSFGCQFAPSDLACLMENAHYQRLVRVMQFWSDRKHVAAIVPLLWKQMKADKLDYVRYRFNAGRALVLDKTGLLKITRLHPETGESCWLG